MQTSKIRNILNQSEHALELHRAKIEDVRSRLTGESAAPEGRKIKYVDVQEPFPRPRRGSAQKQIYSTPAGPKTDNDLTVVLSRRLAYRSENLATDTFGDFPKHMCIILGDNHSIGVFFVGMNVIPKIS
ncbi:MAG: hypothetical protein JWR26_4063 [Pedosphaera sp.]|nr:hypothetical protein [Pedosphaera sp.]